MAGNMAFVMGLVLGAILLTLLVPAVNLVGLPMEAKNIAAELAVTQVLVFAAPGTDRSGRRAWWRAPGRGGSA